MTAADLLPSNATTLERDISRTGDVTPRLAAGIERVRDAKHQDIPDSVVPWLIYEYGLGEITPYVPDLRQALAEGIQWQRVRGTRAAIEIGLGWIGFDALVEESEAGTLRWADFQLELGQAPNGLDFTNNVIQISRLSAPIRSRLFRIYGGYDFRRFRLDDHLLSGGSWLCDDTGVYLRPDWPQLSFGREFITFSDWLTDAVAELGVERARAGEGLYEDRFFLSHSILGETVWRTLHIEDSGVTVSRGHLTMVGPWWQPSGSWGDYSWDQGLDWAGLVNRIQPALKFAKAGLYLSDGAVLGDTNACFSARFEQEVGDGAMVLSEGDPATGEGILSQHVQRLETVEWLERLERDHFGSAVEDRQGIAETSRTGNSTTLAPVEDRQGVAETSRTGQHTTLAPLDDRQAITEASRTGQHTTLGPVENRQGIAEVALTTVYSSESDQAVFSSWQQRDGWDAEPWNESLALVESQHETLA
jgi:P2-related tail formation protein